MLKVLSPTIVEEPQLSAKMLCEYAEATAITRASIIRAAKIRDYGIISIMRRYNEAEELISYCMECSFDFLDILKNYSKDLKKKSDTLTGRDKQNMISSSEAILAFFNLDSKLHKLLDGLIINNTLKNKGHKILINGVKISIRPELGLSTDAGTTPVGFIKLCFCKTKPLKKSIAEGMAVLGRYYYKKVKGLDFDPANCIVIDVFAREIYSAPQRDKRTLSLLAACCDEIADRWDKID